ncbi:S-adenosyl-L-methionine-dependent methyltransferase [Aspergillus pseudonomiae]|uniref:S-adenosyl-L-methionine-dependent methyltransferase n=1 Tax=Aspergillus pseudonomiae TaxID=1506151 RepID=A0A5N7DDA4_9EURO|nr:S-adenosyl-L-methionine-dependent methyltransferase [Aspergillus pseudonomiae]KAE8404382.1 S-adenosyl-L-methionine-dependent methyltransferase [Aspergillus pseudonomiae]
MSPPPDLVELARTVSDSAAQMSQFLQEKKYGDLSFTGQGEGLPPMAPENAPFHKSRIALMEAASTLLQLCMCPRQSVISLCSEFHTSSAVRIAYNYRFAHAVPINGTATYAEIAEKVGLDRTLVERAIGALMGRRIFCQPSPGVVAHTRLSHMMATDENFNSFVGICFDNALVWSAHITDALLKWGCSEEPTETGFNIACGTELNFWEHMRADKGLQERFSKGRAYLSANFSKVAGSAGEFDWGGIGEAVVVEIGGFQGHLSVGLAKKHPTLRFIIQDTQEACEHAQESLPTELSQRIQFEHHDLFQPQSIRHGKVVYLLRSILHDWSDKYAAHILRAICLAMKPDDRLIMCEKILPEIGTVGTFSGRFPRAADMQMWATFNGKERTLAQFQELFEQANLPLQVLNIHSPIGIGLSTLELSLSQ